MPVPVTTRRFTVEEYYRMAEVGILRADERVELIEGEIIEMAAMGSRHASCVSRLTRLLVEGIGERGVVRVQLPLRLSDISEPEPDLAVCRPRADDYAAGHPGSADTLLTVEVADTTVGFDRARKVLLYALAGVREYWLVNLAADEVEVYREPGSAGYRDVRSLRRGDLLRPAAVPDLALPVTDILP